MLGDPFHLPSRGQPVDFSAATHEMLIRGARKSLESAAAKPDATRMQLLAQRAITCQVINTSGADIPMFAPVGLGDVLNWAEIDGDSPPLIFEWTEAIASRPLAITQHTIPKDTSGLCLIEGLTWARVSTSETGDEADSNGVDKHLVPGGGGRVMLLDLPESVSDSVILRPALIRQSGSCSITYDLQHWWFPVGGNSSLGVKFGGTVENKSLASNATHTAVKAAIDSHSGMVAAGKTCTVVYPGNLYDGNVVIAMPATGSLGTASSLGLIKATGAPDPVLKVITCGCS